MVETIFTVFTSQVNWANDVCRLQSSVKMLTDSVDKHPHTVSVIFAVGVDKVNDYPVDAVSRE